MLISKDSGFGSSMRNKNCFLFAPDYVPLNHGSFGAYPRAVRDRLRAFEDMDQQCNDTFVRYRYYDHLEESRAAIASFLKADPATVVFVPNATTAINTVLRSIRWEEGDVILTYEDIYPGIERTVEYLVESTPLQNEKIPVDWPVEDDELAAKFEAAIERINSEQGRARRRVRIAIFDTIMSEPGFRIPFERLTQICREHGVLSMVDGAHGAGHIPLDLTALDADFFTTNLHKWLFVPKACAILQVANRTQPLIRSTVPTSIGFSARRLSSSSNRQTVSDMASPIPKQPGLSEFQQLFQWVATCNNAAYLTVPEALKFRREACGGEEAIMRYCNALAYEGGNRAAEILGTDVLDNASGTARRCAFANVRLPIEYDLGGGSDEDKDEDDEDGKDAGARTAKVKDPAGASQFIMRESARLGTFFALSWVPSGIGTGTANHYWRISAQVYLDLADIEWGARQLSGLCDRVRRGEHLR